MSTLRHGSVTQLINYSSKSMSFSYGFIFFRASFILSGKTRGSGFGIATLSKGAGLNSVIKCYTKPSVAGLSIIRDF